MSTVHLGIFCLLFAFSPFTSNLSAASQMNLMSWWDWTVCAIQLLYTGRDVKRRNIRVDRMRLSDESHTHQSCDPLVPNDLDMAVDQLILHLHILISPFLQMNGDVRCSMQGTVLQNNYPLVITCLLLWSLMCSCWLDQQHGQQAALTEQKWVIHKQKNVGRGKTADARQKGLNLMHILVIHYRLVCQGRQWCKTAYGILWDCHSRGIELILLVRLLSHFM